MNFRQLTIIIGMSLCNLVIFIKIAGTTNIAGTIAPYMISYYYSLDSSITASTIVIITFIGYVVQGTNCLLLSQLARKFDEIYLTLIGLIVGSASMFFSSYIENPYIFVVVFGINIGIFGSNLSYPPIWLGWKVLEAKNKSFATGCALSGFVISPFINGLIFTLIVNPNNDPPEKTQQVGDEKVKLFGEDVYNRFPMSLRYISLLWLFIGLIGCIGLIHKTQPIEKKSTYTGIKIQIFKDIKFWYIFLIDCFKMFPYLFILNVYKILGLLYINDDYFLAYVSGIGFILAAIFRIILGKILDKYEWADVCEWTTATEIVLTLVYFYILEYKALYGLFTILFIVITGTSFLSMWILTEKVFIHDKWVYSFVTFANILVSVSVYLFIGVIIPVINI